MTFGNTNWSSLRFVCANVDRLYWLPFTRSEHGWLMLVYGTVTCCQPWKLQVLGWRREWMFFPFFLVRLGAFIPAPHPASPNSQCRILCIRRIVQTWYQRKGDAEGEIIVVVYPPTRWCWIILEKTVQTLMIEIRNKVEKIKKETNYYFTLDLIHRYIGTSPATPLQPGANPGQPLPITPQQQPFPNNTNSKGKAVGPSLQAELSRASILLPFVSG